MALGDLPGDLVHEAEHVVAGLAVVELPVCLLRLVQLGLATRALAPTHVVHRHQAEDVAGRGSAGFEPLTVEEVAGILDHLGDEVGMRVTHLRRLAAVALGEPLRVRLEKPVVVAVERMGDRVRLPSQTHAEPPHAHVVLRYRLGRTRHVQGVPRQPAVTHGRSPPDVLTAHDQRGRGGADQSDLARGQPPYIAGAFQEVVDGIERGVLVERIGSGRTADRAAEASCAGPAVSSQCSSRTRAVIGRVRLGREPGRSLGPHVEMRTSSIRPRKGLPTLSPPTGDTPPIPSSEFSQVVLTYFVAPTLRPSMNNSIFPAAASYVPATWCQPSAKSPDAKPCPVLAVVRRVADAAGIHVALEDVIGPGTDAVEPQDRAVALRLLFGGQPDPRLQGSGFVTEAGLLDDCHVATTVEAPEPGRICPRRDAARRASRLRPRSPKARACRADSG